MKNNISQNLFWDLNYLCFNIKNTNETKPFLFVFVLKINKKKVNTLFCFCHGDSGHGGRQIDWCTDGPNSILHCRRYLSLSFRNCRGCRCGRVFESLLNPTGSESVEENKLDMRPDGLDDFLQICVVVVKLKYLTRAWLGALSAADREDEVHLLRNPRLRLTDAWLLAQIHFNLEHCRWGLRANVLFIRVSEVYLSGMAN